MTESHWTDKPSLEELTHHGVKGQKWGVTRNLGRSLSTIADEKSAAKRDLNQRVASGQGSKLDTTRVVLGTPVGRLATRGVKGAAQKNADEWSAHIDRVKSGNATVRDQLAKYGQLSFSDLHKVDLNGERTEAGKEFSSQIKSNLKSIKNKDFQEKTKRARGAALGKAAAKVAGASAAGAAVGLGLGKALGG